MKINNKLTRQLLADVKKATAVLILVHTDADGDAVGSAVVLEQILQQINPGLKILKVADQNYRRELSGLITKYNFALKLPGRFSGLVMSVDTATQERLANFDPEQKLQVDFNFDHHIDNQKFGKNNLVDPAAASTGVLLYDLCKTLNQKLTPIMAEALYLSIYSDTGGFAFANTSARVFQLAWECTKLGANPYQLYEQLVEQKELAEIKAFGQALKSTRTYFGGRLILGQIPLKSAVDNRMLIDYIRQEKNALVAVVLPQKENFIKVSFRSKNKKYNVSKIAGKFLGGGHPFAAAGKIKVKSLAAAQKIILTYFKAYVF